MKSLTIFIIILIAFAFLTFILKKRKNGLYYKIWLKFNNFCIGNTIIGILLLFFSYESLPLLSARIWFLMWAIGMLIWLAFIALLIIKIPQIKREKAKEQEYQKYIP